MIRTLLFLLGFGLTVIGFMYIILYLNLLTMGYSVVDYIIFILKRRECIYAIIGLIIITITIFYKGENDNVIYIWYFTKLV